jgi:hypothetical protein
MRDDSKLDAVGIGDDRVDPQFGVGGLVEVEKNR